MSLILTNIKNMLLVVYKDYHDYKVCVDDKFSKPYWGEDAVYDFISSIIKESKHCSDLMKNILTKNLQWLKR